MDKNNLDFNILCEKLVKLAKILHLENKLLSKFEITRVTNMQNEKNDIIKYLMSSNEELSKYNDKNGSIADKSVVDKIKNNLKSIEKIIEDNRTLTLKAVKANKRIIEIFTNHLIKNNEIRYNDKGMKQRNDKVKPLASFKLI